MTDAGRVIFLGTGTSHGVPMIGCSCDTCRSDDPRDRRLRPSIYLEVPGRARILVDTATDLRQQALAHGISRLDAILFTHSHADHVMGFDETRRFNAASGASMPVYADARTWDDLRRTFHYVFDGKPRQGGGIPQVEAHDIEPGVPFSVAGLRVVPVPIWHGRAPILGFRFGDFAYLTDCSGIPDSSYPLLAGVETLVVDALRFRTHPTHFSVDEALEAIARVAPRRAWLTHICHDLSHATVDAGLPAGVSLAYDGLSVDVRVDVD